MYMALAVKEGGAEGRDECLPFAIQVSMTGCFSGHLLLANSEGQYGKCPEHSSRCV